MKQEVGASFLTLLAIRSLDLLFSLAALMVFSPLLLLVAIALRFSGEGEVFYRQVRIGKGGREFYLLKFASMMKNSAAIGAGELTLPNDPRVLPLGRFLRKTKLNELPQLLNVLVGNLSVIGPRPQTNRYFNCYDNIDKEFIIKVRPGLSGVGSILFRDEEKLFHEVSDPALLDEKIIMPFKGRLESWYVKNQSLWLYLKLILLTILVVLFPGYNFPKYFLKELPKSPSELEQFLTR